MADEVDWRLSQQEPWMYGAELWLMRFAHPSAEWDHEHCSLCWAKVTEPVDDGSLGEGYVHGERGSVNSVEERTSRKAGLRIVEAPTDEHWICSSCFMEFAEHFGWNALLAE
jgi:hypothetical protein